MRRTKSPQTGGAQRPRFVLPKVASGEYPSCQVRSGAWPQLNRAGPDREQVSVHLANWRPARSRSRSKRPSRPVNARVMVVASGSKSANASAHAAFVPASGQRRKAVPIWTALAPKVNAAAIPRPSAMPPAAIIGMESLSAKRGSNAKRPTHWRSAAA